MIEKPILMQPTSEGYDKEWADVSGVIKKRIPHFFPEIIFDVGANIGDIALKFVSTYPSAVVYAFEPVPGPYQALYDLCLQNNKIMSFPVALSHLDGIVKMNVPPDSKLSRVVKPGTELASSIQVTALTGDRFCSENGVQSIDYLKIDTEGHDMEVLKGFLNFLERQAVGMIEVEAGILDGSESHIDLNAFQRFLKRFGYHLFYMFEQTSDIYFSGRPILRRVNALFISSRLCEQNTRQRKYSRRWERS